jgi:hypothetical protein
MTRRLLGAGLVLLVVIHILLYITGCTPLMATLEALDMAAGHPPLVESDTTYYNDPPPTTQPLHPDEERFLREFNNQVPHPSTLPSGRFSDPDSGPRCHGILHDVPMGVR